MTMLGAIHSPAHHNSILRRWAKTRGDEIGREGYAGWAVFVDYNEIGAMFVIEHRGPGFPPVHFEFPFRSRRDRRYAFERALAVFRRLVRQ